MELVAPLKTPPPTLQKSRYRGYFDLEEQAFETAKDLKIGEWVNFGEDKIAIYRNSGWWLCRTKRYYYEECQHDHARYIEIPDFAGAWICDICEKQFEGGGF